MLSVYPEFSRIHGLECNGCQLPQASCNRSCRSVLRSPISSRSCRSFVSSRSCPSEIAPRDPAALLCFAAVTEVSIFCTKPAGSGSFITPRDPVALLCFAAVTEPHVPLRRTRQGPERTGLHRARRTGQTFSNMASDLGPWIFAASFVSFIIASAKERYTSSLAPTLFSRTGLFSTV